MQSELVVEGVIRDRSVKVGKYPTQCAELSPLFLLGFQRTLLEGL